MPVSDQPHSSWADVYDLAYEQSFGEAYKRLTKATVKVVVDRVKPPARIVDFGAGTGRLSIVFSEMGFDVTAVEPCAEMLRQLELKRGQTALHTVCSKMEDFVSNQHFDVAICVFTVLLYLLDEESLTKSLTAAHASLKSGGILLIDIPSKAIFRGHQTCDHLIDRSVSVDKHTGDIFIYREDLKVKQPNGDEVKYSDTFQIRYWPEEEVRNALEKTGFVVDTDLRDYFSGTGSHYYIMKKAEQGAPADVAKPRR